MRWTNPVIKVGDTRDREGFLWLPKTNVITKETRWLEFARWREVYTSYKSVEAWSVAWWYDHDGSSKFLLTT